MKRINKQVLGLAPAEDAFSGTVRSDVVTMKNYKTAEFVVLKGAGATGTTKITVEASDDVTPTNVVAIPFKYQAITSGDTPGVVTDATSTGFDTTAGENQIYRIYVDAAQIADANIDYGYVSVKFVEQVDSPCTGAVLISLLESRNDSEVPATAIV